MQLSSPSFRDGTPIPRQQSAEGAELSPPLAWSDLPRGTRSLLLLLEDAGTSSPAGLSKPFLHWAVYNLAPSTPGLELGANRTGLPPPARTAKNDHGRTDYHLPAPRRGTHRFVFWLLALDTTLDPGALGDASREQLFAAFASRVLETAELTGTYRSEHHVR
jgi:Raf kinase inhibitor-like YbhB/YbcL family protein